MVFGDIVAVVVVDEGKSVVVELRGKAEGIGNGADARDGDGTKRGVIVMDDDTGGG